MSDAPPATVQAATPAPGSSISKPGTLPGPSSSPVNATSAASKANQQALAAGEHQDTLGQNQSPHSAPQESRPDQETGTEQATPQQASLETREFVPSGNAHIDQVTSLLHNSKFEGSDSIISEVITDQALSLTSKAKLVDELGNDVAQLVINSLETSVQAVKEAGAAEGKRLKEYAFKKFGGANPEETWGGLQEFAQSQSANLNVEERKAMNEMLSAGGIKAEIVIDSLFSKYKESGNYIERPILMKGDQAVNSSMVYVTKREYQEQIGPAIHKYGEGSQEVQGLRQRRSFSLQRGYN